MLLFMLHCLNFQSLADNWARTIYHATGLPGRVTETLLRCHSSRAACETLSFLAFSDPNLEFHAVLCTQMIQASQLYLHRQYLSRHIRMVFDLALVVL
jgi:hypothetical protein